MTDKELILKAKQAAENAYAPYSSFAVGAALLTETGEIYTGCNVENSSYGATNCAERTAVFKAVSDGKRSFKKLALVGRKMGKADGDICTPCGICRQILSEFCKNDFQILMSADGKSYKEVTLGDLLPNAFSAKNL